MMEAVVLHGSVDHPLSPSQSHYMIRNPSIIHQPFISRPFENVFPSNIHSMGLLRAPPPFLYQPPLLPLPAAHHRRSNSSRGPSCPPPNRNSDRTHPPKPKKSKSPTKVQEKKSPKRSSDAAAGMTSSSTSPSGSDPKEPPNNVREVFPSVSIASKCGTADTGISIITESLRGRGSGVFIISPPPSSLPLPTFSLRPKLSCDAEAAGIGNGATDNLRRFLGLQRT